MAFSAFPDTIRRTDGSIDFDHYGRRARDERRRTMNDIFMALMAARTRRVPTSQTRP